jgi:tape measure domain-containing protein
VEEAGIRLSLAGRRELAQGLSEAEEGFEQLGAAAEDSGRKGEQAGRRWDKTRGILGGIGRGIMTGVKITAGVAAAAGAIGIKTAASMETARIGFATMLGSGRKARAFLSDLADFAAKTPFAFPELQTASSRLVSAGVETRKIIPMMTTLGDVTAGMGTGSEGITRATNALQQMIAAQRISAEDLNQLRDAGIPVYDLLASALGKTKGEVVALKDEGKLGGEALTALLGALETGKGLERFNGLMEKQSSSLEGRWSTLKDTVTMGLAGAVKPAIPLVKDLLGVANDLAVKAMPKIESALKSGVRWVRSFMREWKRGGGGKSGLSTAMASLNAPGVPKTAGQIGDAIERIGDALEGVDWAGVKEGLGAGVGDTLTVAGIAIAFIADHAPTFAKYLPMIVAGVVAWKVAQAAANIASLAAVPLIIAQTASNFALAGAMRAQTTATAGAAAAQRGLNFAMLASPLGIVIGLIVLVAGAMYLAYQKSETFRGIVDTLWNGVLKPFGTWLGGVLLDAIVAIAKGILDMGRFGITAFRWLLTAAFATFDGILLAAEKGLGWVPGLGDKIKGARAAFNEFGDATIEKLKRVEDRLRETSNKLDDVARDRTSTITVNTVYSGLSAPGGSGPTRGRDDDFAPRRPGNTPTTRAPRVNVQLPRVPDSPAELEDIDPDLFRRQPGDPDDRDETIEIPISLDGEVIARKTVKRIHDKAARR